MKKLKVLGTNWHTAHQHRISKLSFIERYDLLISNRTWADKQRPFPDNFRLVPYIDPKEDYDFAILHIDQQVVEPRISKGKIFFELMVSIKEAGIPLVIINHMTPFSDRLDSKTVIEKVKTLVGDTPMITNSHQAAKQWGWGNPIVHGYEVDEFYNKAKEPRILTVLSGAGMNKAYKRRLLKDTMEIMEDKWGEKIIWIGGNAPSRNSWHDYRQYLSRSLIYFNPTHNSPMPGARTEAMLSGACVVSTRHHDWENYITHGEDGFIVKDNPKHCAYLLHELLHDYDRAYKVGQKGRETAMKYFNKDRFEKDWIKFLKKVGIWK